MNTCCRVAVALVLGAVGAGAAVAAPTPDYIQASPKGLAAAYGDGVARLVFSNEMTRARAEFIKGSLSPSSGCGADPKFTLSEASPYKIDTNDVMWIERYEVGCKDTLHRSMLVLLKGNDYSVLPLLPGVTIADPNLQVDAANIVTTAALIRTKKPCEEAAIADTQVMQRPPRGGGAWKERWLVKTCDEMQDVTVNFTPSPGGGTDINVGPG